MRPTCGLLDGQPEVFVGSHSAAALRRAAVEDNRLGGLLMQKEINFIS